MTWKAKVHKVGGVEVREHPPGMFTWVLHGWFWQWADYVEGKLWAWLDGDERTFFGAWTLEEAVRLSRIYAKQLVTKEE